MLKDIECMNPLKIRLPYCKTLSNKEWNRIVDSLDKEKRIAEKWKKLDDERKAKYEYSKALSKNWDNTPVGKRKIVLAKLEEKAAKKMEHQIKLDTEEAEYKAKKDQQCISRANKLLFFERDRIKLLNNAFRLGEICKEREAQIEFKKKYASIYNKAELDYIEHILQDVKKFKEEEEYKNSINKMKKSFYMLQLTKEIERKEKQRLYERLDALRETREMHDCTQNQHINERRRKTKKQQKLYKEELDELIKNKQYLENAIKQKEKESEEKANKCYFSMKNRENIIKEKEKEKYLERWKSQINAINYLAEMEIQKKNKEDYLHEKAVKEKGENIALAYIEKEQKRLDEAKLRKQVYHQQIAELKQKKYEEIFNDLENKHLLVEDYNNWQEEERKKEKERLKEAKTNQDFLLFQMEWNKKHKRKNIVDIEDYNKLIESVKNEDNAFQLYAKNLIKDREEKGRNIYALRKAAVTGIGREKGPIYKDRGFLQPKYISADINGDDLFYVKSQKIFNDTYKNLGYYGLFSE